MKWGLTRRVTFLRSSNGYISTLLSNSRRTLATGKSNTTNENFERVYDPTSEGVSLRRLDTFPRRHLGLGPSDMQTMLETLGYSCLDDFLKNAIPEHILIKRKLQIEPSGGYSELEMLEHLHDLASKNRIAKSLIGKGYYGTLVPPVIQRNLLECPEWYTPYTPYQPEISQGRLESLLNFQTMVMSLTGLDIANASLLDEGTAAGEAVSLSFHTFKGKRKKYVVDKNLHPQTIDVIKTRTNKIGVEVIELSLPSAQGLEELKTIASDLCGVMVAYPATCGSVHDFTELERVIHQDNAVFTMATDLLALALLKPPSFFNADIALGSAQRFGVPLGYGGPHAAFFAANNKYSRKVPGRIVGVSKDRLGNQALRLALQTREQHIKREKATSNICTSQALLANMSAMYAVYHGPKGLRNIAERTHGFVSILADQIRLNSDHRVLNDTWFDTITVQLKEGCKADFILQKALDNYNINLFKVDEDKVSLSFDETIRAEDLSALVELFTENSEFNANAIEHLPKMAEDLLRTDEYLTHPVFNTHHSETAMLRYLHLLQSKDLTLANSMIPLGSCTMKLNATVEMSSLTIPGFSNIHPFAPPNQAEGYNELIANFERDLNDITGFDATTLMPNSGAQGEFTGLSLIRQYFKSRGTYDTRNVCLIPVSAHGTNPASAAMCGLKVVSIKCLSNGSIDLNDLKAKAEKHADNLCAIMITYPSTYGLFEPGIKSAIDIVHEKGGQVYLDGANMNAQVGLTSPGDLGADVCHLNIHKTFALSHGGGGPGQGPVCVREHLKPFLPKHRYVSTPHSSGISITPVNSAPYGSALVLPVSYSYVKMLGSEGLTYVSAIAILNANYMIHRLKEYYQVLFIDSRNPTETGSKHCAHEFIIDMREFKQVGIEAIDIAKRLQDYGFHAPTMSFPVAGTLMVEPTESEDLGELNRFVDSLISIRKEIDAYSKGETVGLVLKNAPHPLLDVISTPQEEWNVRGYTREEACFPLPFLKHKKCWPTVARLEDTYGDMHLMCSCPSVEDISET